MKYLLFLAISIFSIEVLADCGVLELAPVDTLKVIKKNRMISQKQFQEGTFFLYEKNGNEYYIQHESSCCQSGRKFERATVLILKDDIIRTIDICDVNINSHSFKLDQKERALVIYGERFCSTRFESSNACNSYNPYIKIPLELIESTKKDQIELKEDTREIKKVKTKRAYFYKYPFQCKSKKCDSKTNSYVINDDDILITWKYKKFVYASFKNSKGKVTNGWVLKSKLAK